MPIIVTFHPETGHMTDGGWGRPEPNQIKTIEPEYHALPCRNEGKTNIFYARDTVGSATTNTGSIISACLIEIKFACAHVCNVIIRVLDPSLYGSDDY